MVNKTTISKAIRKHRIITVEEIGRATGAGTSCGRCKPSIAQIIAETKINTNQLAIIWNEHPDSKKNDG
jgi:assimilatory nitrate reductase catalytic subunit